MGNPLYTDALDLAAHQGKSWAKNIRGGVLASLAPNDPTIKVGETDHFTFTGTPKAQLVGEGGKKKSADGTPTKAKGKTYKVQLTYRFSDEVKYADEDYQIGLIDKLVGNIATALSRALDVIAIHGVDPSTGEVSGSVINYFTKGGNGVGHVTATANPDKDIEAAATQLQTAGYVATGIAFDPAYVGALARERDEEGRKLYPELGLGFNITNFQGLQAASSDTVSGRQELGPENAFVKSLIGDFNAFEWGVAREVPLELIEYGNPDGKGDLKEENEIAIRAEAILGFVIFDGAAFSVISELASS